MMSVGGEGVSTSITRCRGIHIHEVGDFIKVWAIILHWGRIIIPSVGGFVSSKALSTMATVAEFGDSEFCDCRRILRLYSRRF